MVSKMTTSHNVPLALANVCVIGLCLLPVQQALAKEEALSPLDAAKIYDRAKVGFYNAFYFKPDEQQRTNAAFGFAPLMLQAVGRGRLAGPPRRPNPSIVPGALSLSGGTVVLDHSKPVVYAGIDSVQLNGKPHPRFTYLWCYSTRKEPGQSPGLALQGVRITLNSTGMPAIWEVLADTSGADLLFVSASLELEAKAQFGGALPGRGFAIEQSTNQAPEAIVARVIDDGPVAMGPIVYLDAKTHAVSTLICRCMPAQAKNLVGSATYKLLPLDKSAQALLDRVKVDTAERTAFWPGQLLTEARVGKRLRLPGTF